MSRKLLGRLVARAMAVFVFAVESRKIACRCFQTKHGAICYRTSASTPSGTLCGSSYGRFCILFNRSAHSAGPGRGKWEIGNGKWDMGKEEMGNRKLEMGSQIQTENRSKIGNPTIMHSRSTKNAPCCENNTKHKQKHGCKIL